MTTKNKPIAPARTLALLVTIATLKHRHEIAAATAPGYPPIIGQIEDLLTTCERDALAATCNTANSITKAHTTAEADDQREMARAQFIYSKVNMNNARKLITKLERLAAKAVRS